LLRTVRSPLFALYKKGPSFSSYVYRSRILLLTLYILV
jgi:hypothetical protein